MSRVAVKCPGGFAAGHRWQKATRGAQSLSTVLISFFLLWIGSVSLLGAAPAENRIAATVGNFKTVDWQENGRKSVLLGREAKPVAGGHLQITGLRIETYGTNGVLELLVQAPECLFDPAARVAYSSGPLSFQAADGRFALQGKGFGWWQLESRLVLSNEVTTVIRKDVIQELAGGAPGTPQPQSSAQLQDVLEIEAGHLEFQNDIASYRDNVRVRDPQGTVTCQQLAVFLAPDADKVQRVEAAEEVVMRHANATARSDKAVYQIAEDEFVLSGEPSWEVDDKEGTSEQVIVNLATRDLRALGRVRMQFPGGAILPEELFAEGGESRAKGTDGTNASEGPVTIGSDEFLYESGVGLFTGSVVVAQGDTKMHAGRLIVHAESSSKPPHQIVAQDGVVVMQDQSEIRADAAEYDAVQGWLVFSGEPKWKQQAREGSADLLRVKLDEKKLFALGNVRVRMPASAAQSLSTNLASVVESDEATTAGVPGFMTIRSGQLEHGPGSTIFSENVVVTHPKATLECDWLRGLTSQTNGAFTTIVAEGNVEIEQADRRALGQRAIYYIGSDLIEMTGSPRLVMPDQSLSGEKLLLDLKRNTFHIKGNYQIEVDTKKSLPALVPERRGPVAGERTGKRIE